MLRRDFGTFSDFSVDPKSDSGRWMPTPWAKNKQRGTRVELSELWFKHPVFSRMRVTIGYTSYIYQTVTVMLPGIFEEVFMLQMLGFQFYSKMLGKKNTLNTVR